MDIDFVAQACYQKVMPARNRTAELLARALLRLLFGLFYRIRSRGRGLVPRGGPALLVSNHVSFIDAFLVGLACPRSVRFLMFRAYYDLPAVGWLFRALGCIPVSDRDGPRAILESFGRAQEALRAGEAVCIFAEGEISRHGQMLRFKKGFERILEGLDVPVVPVHLDEVWGSVFSFEGGRVLFKRPRRLPYPVTVSFGPPLPPTASAFEVRQAISELGAEAFRNRLEASPPLPAAFLREAKRHPWRLAVADSTGLELSYGGLLFRAAALASLLGRRLGGEERVGVLLPPTASAALANLALSLLGRIPVNLNYTLARDMVSACAFKAGIKRVLTSRRFTERLGWEPEGALHMEDLAPGPGLVGLAWAAALLLLPRVLAERLLPKAARGTLGRPATVLFTSGATGLPKGVVLSHANILSNILAVSQVYQLTGRDRVLGVLPFFHSFGLTCTLWLPLLSGMGAVYHYTPLEAKAVGELARRYGATFLLATPTFLLGYLRRVEPEQFRSLRYVVAGAERLRGEVADAFEEKFGLAPLEGYGCTELSPVASVNIPDIAWPGVRQKGSKPGTVGHPLPGVFMKVVDPATGRPLAAGEAGLLLVKGPNVMLGYLGDEALTRESLRDGYYVTGDVASIDEDGFVTITDRLSRFSKVGGEMVPHILLEAKLHEAAGLLEQSFVVTGLPDARRGERLAVLCKGSPDVPGLLAKLAAMGLPKLWIPSAEDFFQVEDFPLLGSGKLDLSRLKAVAAELEARRGAR